MAQQKWDSRDITDQQGRVAIVTGSSSGIGYETARVLANKNATVIIAVRNQEKGEKAAAKIRSGHAEADVAVMLLDLANLASVRAFAAQFQQQYSRLDLLINNAGVMVPPYGKTVDGFELQFGTNHLGHFALTGLLLDLLRRTPGSRIVNVSSNMHKTGRINFDDLNWENRRYNAWQAYGDSKIANLYFTRELARQLAGAGDHPLVAAAHPGWTATELQRNTGAISLLNYLFAQDITMGALPTLYAALAEDVRPGDYFGPSGIMEMRGYPKQTTPSQRARDAAKAQRLWEVSETLTGVRYAIAEALAH